MVKRVRLAWNSVREPRHIKVIYLIFYWVAIVGGILTLISPPSLVTFAIGGTLTMFFAGFLLLGGIAGALAVFPGWWWLERLGLWSLLLACLEFLIVVTAEGGSAVAAQNTMGLFAAGLWVLRLPMIWKYSFEPRGERAP